MTEHKTCIGRTRPGSGRYAALCDCDWVGPIRTVRDLAQADANAHELAMLGEDGELDDALTTQAL